MLVLPSLPDAETKATLIGCKICGTSPSDTPTKPASVASSVSLLNWLLQPRPIFLERNALFFFYTRALNRLAQLTDYWIGEDEARPLWQELMEYALSSMEEGEQLQALNVIRENAPWFAQENEQHFQF